MYYIFVYEHAVWLEQEGSYGSGRLKLQKES